jgi:amino acid adenylation domain-containing protein
MSDPPVELCLHELVTRQAARSPRAVAVRAGDDHLTFADLDMRSNQLANLLRARGVGPERTVAVCVDRSVSTVVAVLGTLKAGGAYVPVNPDDPILRQREVVEDANSRVVIVEPSAAARWERTDSAVVALDARWSALDSQPAHAPASSVTPANAAYVLYTSGSTGRPKGVVVEHRQVTSYLSGVLRRLAITEQLTYLMLQPLTVDSSVTMLFPPLCVGGELHLVGRSESLNAAYLAEYCRTHRIDCLKIAPSHLRALQSSPHFADVLPRRVLVVGGEASDWAWIRELQRGFTGRIYGHYGPTETTVGVLMLPVVEHMTLDLPVTPLGDPIVGTRCLVVDNDGRRVPDGDVGELCVGGSNVGRGYLGRPDLTAAAFVPDVSDPCPGGRLYRTGDMVRRLPDGGFEFLGRTDDQVKIRGFRVELAEIERVLRELPNVDAAVVVAPIDPSGERRIVANILPRAGAVVAGERAVRDFLAARLPAHMVPAVVVTLTELPLTPHGKVDRKALARLPHTVAPTVAAAVAGGPEAAVERAWRQVLKVDRVGLDENFFDVGGHSLLLVELHAALQAAFETEFDLVQLFNHTTVRAQAAYLSTDRRSSVRARPRRGEQSRRRSPASRRPKRPNTVVDVDGVQ